MLTEQKTFGPYAWYWSPALVIIEANAGSVLLEVSKGNDQWQTVKTFTENDQLTLAVANGEFRMTPLDGARYSWQVQTL